MSSKIPCAHFSDINIQGDLHGETGSEMRYLAANYCEKNLIEG
jgi:hypothetical protein